MATTKTEPVEKKWEFKDRTYFLLNNNIILRIYLSYNIHKAKTIIVNKVLMKSEIINKLDELYSNYLVYRTIIVCDDSSQDKYVNILKDNNNNIKTDFKIFNFMLIF